MISLLWLVVYILFVALVVTLMWWALGLIPGLPPNVRSIIVAIVAVICVIWILTAIMRGGPIIFGGPL